MKKTQYLSLIRDVTEAVELAGIRQSLDHDPDILPAERHEVEKALDLKGRRLAAE